MVHNTLDHFDSCVSAIASISKTVSSASTTLYAFVNETRNVDQTVKDLATEVNALSRALTEVEAVIKGPIVVAAEKHGSEDDNKQLWQTLYGSLEDCQITADLIGNVVDAARRTVKPESSYNYPGQTSSVCHLPPSACLTRRSDRSTTLPAGYLCCLR